MLAEQCSCQRTQEPDITLQMQMIRVTRTSGPECSSEGAVSLSASKPNRFPYHTRPRILPDRPLPEIEIAEDNKKQPPHSELEIHLGDPAEHDASASILREGIKLPTNSMAHESSDPIQDVGTENHVYSNTSWEHFQSKVLSLPPEVRNIIEDILYADTFGPREVHSKTDAPVTEMFLSLDKQLYHKYSQIYWSKNSWIVGAGAANDSMRFMTLPPYNPSTAEFSRQVPNNAAFKIRHIELHFTKNDLSSPSRQRQTTLPNTSSPPSNYGAKPTTNNTLNEYKTECRTLASELAQIWQDKFDRVAFLHLDRFTLDVTQAYAPDGAFLGVEVVRRLLPFVYGMPVDFRIVAPTKVLEGEVRRAFEGVNEDAAL